MSDERASNPLSRYGCAETTCNQRGQGIMAFCSKARFSCVLQGRRRGGASRLLLGDRRAGSPRGRPFHRPRRRIGAATARSAGPPARRSAFAAPPTTRWAGTATGSEQTLTCATDSTRLIVKSNITYNPERRRDHRHLERDQLRHHRACHRPRQQRNDQGDRASTRQAFHRARDGGHAAAATRPSPSRRRALR